MANLHGITRLQDIKNEMKELLEEAHDILRDDDNNRLELRRAESYWYAHIKMALDSEHGFLGSSMCNMQETIDAVAANAMDAFDDPDVEDFDDTYDWVAENQDLVHRAAARRRSGCDL